MKKALPIVTLSILLVLILAACSGQSPASGAKTVTNANVKIDTNPNPAVVGDTELVLTVTDQNGNAVEGAKVDVNAEHPDMKGMGMGGPATEQGGGKYAIKAKFSMSGNWKVTVVVRKGELNVKQEILLVVK
jgi:nitrogen fixation protein FixH